MNPRRKSLLPALVQCLLAIAAVSVWADDWPSSGHDLANSGHNPHEQTIGPKNVADLAVRWRLRGIPVYGTPVVVDGIVYVANASGVLHARRATNGARIWRTVYRDVPWSLDAGAFTAPVVAANAVYVVDRSGTARRFDRDDGAILWETPVDTHPRALVDGDPIVYDGLLIVPVSSFENDEVGVDLTMRGNITAIDVESGEIVWKCFTTSDQSLAAPKFGAGVGIWSSPAVDPETNLLYVGTGQHYEPGFKQPDPESRQDVDYSDSLLAVAVQNGRIRKHHQFTAGDIWGAAYPQGHDWDVGAPPNLFEIPRPGSGKPMSVVGVGDKEGTYYVLDRTTLAEVWRRKISAQSVIGGIQSAASYAEGLLFVAGHEMQSGSSFNEIIPEGQSFAWLSTADGYRAIQEVGRINFFALDAATGEVRWEESLSGGVSFAPVITANGLVFLGSSDGKIRAYVAETGELMFEARISRQLFGVELVDVIMSMSVADGMLFVSHFGFPGGLMVFSLPD